MLPLLTSPRGRIVVVAVVAVAIVVGAAAAAAKLPPLPLKRAIKSALFFSCGVPDEDGSPKTYSRLGVDAGIDIPTTFDVGRAFLPDPEADDEDSEDLRRDAHDFLGGAEEGEVVVVAGVGIPVVVVDVEAVVVVKVVGADVVKAVTASSAVVDATDFSSRTSSSPLSGIVPFPTTAGRETEVVDVAGDPETVEEVELSMTEAAEEGTVDESVAAAAATSGTPFSLSVSFPFSSCFSSSTTATTFSFTSIPAMSSSPTTGNVTDGSGGGDGGGVRISNACRTTSGGGCA